MLRSKGGVVDFADFSVTGKTVGTGVGSLLGLYTTTTDRRDSNWFFPRPIGLGSTSSRTLERWDSGRIGQSLQSFLSFVSNNDIVVFGRLPDMCLTSTFSFSLRFIRDVVNPSTRTDRRRQ